MAIDFPSSGLGRRKPRTRPGSPMYFIRMVEAVVTLCRPGWLSLGDSRYLILLDTLANTAMC